MGAIIKMTQLKDSERVIDTPYKYVFSCFKYKTVHSFIICLLFFMKWDIYRESGSSLKICVHSYIFPNNLWIWNDAKDLRKSYPLTIARL